MSKTNFAALLLAIGLALGVSPAVAADAPKGAPSPPPESSPAKGEGVKAEPLKGADVAKAEAARKTPLQRCDQLADKAQVDCLQKARERIVEARQKREAGGKSGQ